jgi:hypothetical protein
MEILEHALQMTNVSVRWLVNRAPTKTKVGNLLAKHVHSVNIKAKRGKPLAKHVQLVNTKHTVGNPPAKHVQVVLTVQQVLQIAHSMPQIARQVPMSVALWPFVIHVMLVNTMAKQAKRHVKFAVLVNMLQILAEQQIAIKVALLENTSVIRQQQPNTTKNPIVTFAVLGNIRQLQVLENAPSVAPVNILIHLKEQQIVIFVSLASTSVIRQQLPNTTKNPIVLSAVLENTLQLLVQRIVSCVLPASTSMILLRQLANTIKNPIVSCAVLVHIQQP